MPGEPATGSRCVCAHSGCQSPGQPSSDCNDPTNVTADGAAARARAATGPAHTVSTQAMSHISAPARTRVGLAAATLLIPISLLQRALQRFRLQRFSRVEPVSSEHQPRPSENGARKRAGLVAVARKLGVSPSTVSNAYNRPDQLSAALRQRVLDTAAELGYAGPDPSARQLRRGRAGAIGVVFFEHLPYAFGDPAAVRFMHGVSDILDARELNMVLVPGPRGHTHRGAAVQNAAVDAFIVHGLAHPDPLLDATLKRRLATVIVDSQPLAGIDFVGIDDHAAALTATQHLLDLGHRQIGILSFQLQEHDAPGGGAPATAPRGEGVNERRLAGCRHALQLAGLDQSNLTVEGCREISETDGRARTHALLDRVPDITAVFAFSDVLALGAKQAAHDRGLAASELSIVGFDDTAPATEDLTSVHQPQRAKGRAAAEVVVRALEPDPPAPRHQLLPTLLVTRASSAAAPGA